MTNITFGAWAVRHSLHACVRACLITASQCAHTTSPRQAGIRGKFRSGGPRKGFWEHAEDKYDKQTITDIRAALGVYRVFMYGLPLVTAVRLLLLCPKLLSDLTLAYACGVSPLPVFWSLFDQHASRWVFQVCNPFPFLPSLRAPSSRLRATTPCHHTTRRTSWTERSSASPSSPIKFPRSTP
jgi:hypothetical protein